MQLRLRRPRRRRRSGRRATTRRGSRGARCPRWGATRVSVARRGERRGGGGRRRGGAAGGAPRVPQRHARRGSRAFAPCERAHVTRGDRVRQRPATRGAGAPRWSVVGLSYERSRGQRRAGKEARAAPHTPCRCGRAPSPRCARPCRKPAPTTRGPRPLPCASFQGGGRLARDANGGYAAGGTNSVTKRHDARTWGAGTFARLVRP